MPTHPRPESNAPPRRRVPAALWVVLGLAVLAFAPAVGGEFLDWDDTSMVVDNADLRPGAWPSILGYWDPRRPHLGLYAPLTYTLYYAIAMASHAVAGGLRPMPFHVVGIVLHLATGLIVWRLLRRLTARRWTPIAGAALVLLHPMQVEPAAWIASLNTVLAGCLTMAALWLYVRAAQGGGRGAFAASCALFALALLAKPSPAAMPLAALAIDRLLLRSAWRSALARAATWTAIAAPILLAGRLAQPAADVVVPRISGRLLVAADAAGFYATHLVVPFRYAIDYGRTPAAVLAGGAATVAFVAVGCGLGVALVWASVRGHRRIAASLWVALAGVLPVLGLVPFDFQLNSTVADRYTYLAMLGPAIALATLLPAAWPRRPAAAIVALALALLAHLQARTWTDNDALFAQALDVNPDSPPAHATLAYLHARRVATARDGATQRRYYASALAHGRRALAVRPDDARARFNLANLLLRYGDPREAADEYERASHLPKLAGDARLYVNWGIALGRAGRPDEARRTLDRALELSPGMPEAIAARRSLDPAAP